MKIAIVSFVLLGSITSVMAQVNDRQVRDLIGLGGSVVNSLVPILVTLALLAFFWFLIKFIWKGTESPEERRKGVSGMGWSILALFVMVSIWGIIAFMQGTLGINGTADRPEVNPLPHNMRQ